MTAPPVAASGAAVLLVRLQDGLDGLNGWRAGLVCGLLGALAVLGFAPFFIWPAFAVSVLLLAALLDASARRSRAEGWRFGRALRSVAWRGWCFGAGNTLAGMTWVATAFLVDAERFAALIPLALAALSGGLGLFWAMGAMLYRVCWSPTGWRMLAFAGAYGAAELARGHWFTGLPWNLPAYVFEAGGLVSQSGALLGAYGVSALAVLVFAAPLAWGSRGGRFVIALAVALTGAALAFGAWRLHEAGAPGARTAPGAPLIAAGQAGFTQAEVWDAANAVRIVTSHLTLLERPEAADADIVVWPESAMPVILLQEPGVLEAINARLGDRTLVTGTLRMDDAGFAGGKPLRQFTNSVVSIVQENGALRLGGLHDKHHLVPFGEYVPFQDLLSRVGLESLASVVGGITPGPEPGVMSVPGAPAADPRVCYEIIFPDFNRPAARTAGWILNVSVDAWYGDGLGPDQHYALARWRAIETGLPLVRAASGGWSAVIDPWGRALAEHRRGAGYAVAKLPDRTTTIYSSLLPPWSLVVLVLFLMIVGGFSALLSQGLTSRQE